MQEDFEKKSSNTTDLTFQNSVKIADMAGESASAPVKAIAFYLPQFHPIPENDQWWGSGFTEWTNVTKALPQHPNHYQPHRPRELGYYDLRVPEVLRQQQELARRHGIYGFCYYYYWFSGRRLLERPLFDMIASDTDFPFCVCWANENWTRRWDGSDNEVLISQEHSQENDEHFIKDLLPILRDSRYIRIGGAPLIIVYRAGILKNPVVTASTWRRICAENGIPQIHLCAVQSFGLKDPIAYGFDSAVEFPPHTAVSDRINDKVPELAKSFSGDVYDYQQVVRNAILMKKPDYPLFRGAMPSWDNTARRGSRSTFFYGSNPELYEEWLSALVRYTVDSHPPEKRYVFINAWNEWAEGAHLEPDQEYGTQYLESTRRALFGTAGWSTIVNTLRTYHPDTHTGALLDALSRILRSQDRSLQYVTKLTDLQSTLKDLKDRTVFTDQAPAELRSKPLVSSIHMQISRINQYISDDIKHPQVKRSAATLMSGWCFHPNIHQSRNTPIYLVFKSQGSDDAYYAVVHRRYKRDDVSMLFNDYSTDATEWSGFHGYFDLSRLKPGSYLMSMALIGEDFVATSQFKQIFSVL